MRLAHENKRYSRSDCGQVGAKHWLDQGVGKVTRRDTAEELRIT